MNYSSLKDNKTELNSGLSILAKIIAREHINSIEMNEPTREGLSSVFKLFEKE